MSNDFFIIYFRVDGGCILNSVCSIKMGHTRGRCECKGEGFMSSFPIKGNHVQCVPIEPLKDIPAVTPNNKTTTID